jgi:hypothetical protein
MILRLIVVLAVVLRAGVGLAQTSGADDSGAVSGQSSQESANVTEAFRVEAVICSQIVDRMPADTLNEFTSLPVDAYLWLRVVGIADTATVTVTWFFNGAEMRATALPVRSPSWRTWAWKTIRPGQSGDWEARVQGPDGEIVKSVSFKVK